LIKSRLEEKGSFDKEVDWKRKEALIKKQTGRERKF